MGTETEAEDVSVIEADRVAAVRWVFRDWNEETRSEAVQWARGGQTPPLTAEEVREVVAAAYALARHRVAMMRSDARRREERELLLLQTQRELGHARKALADMCRFYDRAYALACEEVECLKRQDSRLATRFNEQLMQLADECPTEFQGG